MIMRILIADGDVSIRNELKVMLSQEGFIVDLVSDGIAAIKQVRRHDYNLAILDFKLPELDGKTVARQIRKISNVPFIFLSTETDEKSILNAFSLGAEDYIAKPFSVKQLLARIKAVLRRTMVHENTTPRSLVFDGLYIDTVSHSVYVDDKQILLTPKEYLLLIFLAKNPNQAFSRETLLTQIWGQDYFGSDRTIDTHIKTLREAIKPYQHFISTIRGFGYIFSEIKEGAK